MTIDTALQQKIEEVFDFGSTSNSPAEHEKIEKLKKSLYVIFRSDAGRDLKEALLSGKFDPPKDTVANKVLRFLKGEKTQNVGNKIEIHLNDSLPDKTGGQCSNYGKRINIAQTLTPLASLFTLAHELTHVLQYHTGTAYTDSNDPYDSVVIDNLTEVEARLKKAELILEMKKKLTSKLNLSANLLFDSFILLRLQTEKLQELKTKGKDQQSAIQEAEIFAKTQFVQSVLKGDITETAYALLKGKCEDTYLTLFRQKNENWQGAYDEQAVHSFCARRFSNKHKEITPEKAREQRQEIIEKIATRVGIPVETITQLDQVISQKIVDDRENLFAKLENEIHQQKKGEGKVKRSKISKRIPPHQKLLRRLKQASRPQVKNPPFIH